MRSVAGRDYTITSITVTFQATETSQVVMVPILGDNTLEGVEQFTVRLFLPAGQKGVVLGSDTATVEITDDDCKLFTYPVILYRRYHNHLCILFSSCDSRV